MKPTRKLADQSDAVLSQLISAAGGTAMFSAQAQVDQFSGSTDPCPAVAVAGRTVTLTATITSGCVAYQISGSDRMKACS